MDCKHDGQKMFVKLEHVRAGKPAYHRVYQCQICGCKLPHGAKGGCFWPDDDSNPTCSLPPFSFSVVEAWKEKEKAENHNSFIAAERQRNAEFRKKHQDYELYIKTSPEWKARRDLVMARCRWVCEACLSAHAVDVHHVNYDSLFCEVLWDLHGVCRECHEKIHGRKFV